jgi:hypothetical protein
LNSDFLIKASLVLFDQRAKYEVGKLKNDSFITTLDSRYDKLNYCIRQMSAWLDDVARIKCGRFLRSRLALIPILDYMMLSGKLDKPDGDNGKAMTEYLYMAFFRRLFSRAADTVLDQLHALMVQEVEKGPQHFPIEAIRSFLTQRQNTPYQIDQVHLNNDADLALNIVHGGFRQLDPSDLKYHPKDLKLELDHIFPRAPLTNSGLGDVVDHLGNYRLIVMLANRHKLASMPDASTDFFGKEDADVSMYFQLTLEDLAHGDQAKSRESFTAFCERRAALIREHVAAVLGVTLGAEI